MNTIAQILAKRRKVLGMTQKELAEKLNVSDKTLSRWETGKQIPDAMTVLEIAKALDLTITEIYGTGVPQDNLPTQAGGQRKTQRMGKVLRWICVGMIAVWMVSVIGIWIYNSSLQSKVSFECREVPLYALTQFDYSVVDWIERCNEEGQEIAYVSRLDSNTETGEEEACFLFYLPRGYEGTQVKVRHRLGINGNVLEVAFNNLKEPEKDNYYLCCVKAAYTDGLGLDVSLDGKRVRLAGLGFVTHLEDLCEILFPQV